MLVRFQDVSKAFGAFNVVSDVSFQIQPGQKIGLIGPNGAGKTTLLNLISAPGEADQGTITFASGIRIGRLEQIPNFAGDTSLVGEALRAFQHLQKQENQLREMEVAMSDAPNPELLERYSQLQHEFEFGGGYSYRAQTEGALLGVGFRQSQFSQSADTLSGGEKNRLALAKLLLSDVNFLLLDEPTNHLDIRSIEWLEHYLKETDKAILVVSHDRFFLDRIVTRILDLEEGHIADYPGNYQAYLRQHALRMDLRRKEWQRQQEWIARTEDYVRRNIAGQKTRQAQSRRKALARIKRIEKPPTAPELARFRFLPATKTGRYVLTARELSVGYSGNPILEDLNADIERGERWALVGPNGSGKTTLLRSLIGQLPHLGGELSWDDRLEVGYYDQQLEDLDSSASVLEEIRSMDFQPTDGELRGFLAQFLFSGEDVFKQVSQLSGGEKSRLMLAKIIYAAPPLLALDEPTNHLDIASREALEDALTQYPGTMLFVTHDRYLVQKIASHIIYMDDGRARTFDRFEAFEEWLGDSVDARVESEAPASNTARKPAAGLSKNKRERLVREIKDLETRIEENERELKEIENLFQEPPQDMEWDRTNRRYSELKEKLEVLYQELADRWELIG